MCPPLRAAPPCIPAPAGMSSGTSMCSALRAAEPCIFAPAKMSAAAREALLFRSSLYDFFADRLGLKPVLIFRGRLGTLLALIKQFIDRGSALQAQL